MNRLLISAVAIGLGLTSTVGHGRVVWPATDVPPSCPVTIPARLGFTPPTPYPAALPFSNVGWVGTPALWTFAPADGIYRGLRVAAGYRQKLFWWHPGFDGRQEPRPDFTLTATRLDAGAPPFVVRNATNAHNDSFGGWTILVMPDLPDPGCWRLTGTYRGASFGYVVWFDR